MSFTYKQGQHKAKQCNAMQCNPTFVHAFDHWPLALKSKGNKRVKLDQGTLLIV